MKIEIKSRSGAHRFDAEDGERILYAGLRDGLNLPYECATGTCGTCKARLVEGEIEELWADAPGKKNLKSAQGEFLMCQCAAKGPVVAEVAQFVGNVKPGVVVPQWIDGALENPRNLTHDVIAVDVKLDNPVSFDAGQFMAVQIPGIEGARGYSMVNYAAETDRLEFVIKKLPGGGVSEWLFGEDRTGTKVRMLGPLGIATFHPDSGKNLLCIAGGTGIAGIMSIIDRACQDKYFEKHRGDVFFGVRTSRDAFYLDELSAYAKRFPDGLSVTVAFSDESADDAFKEKYEAIRFDEGFVHDAAARHMAGRFENVVAYLAGPPPAVDASIRLLIMSRVSADNIKYDKFS
jgi:toluene monooxygenase electron transfer component